MTTLQTADRVLAALFLLADSGESGPSRVAHELQVSKATAFNLLRTLEKHGLATLNPETQRYALGPAVYRLNSGAEGYVDLVLVARPVMEKLRDHVNETVTLHTRIGRERVCIERFESRHVLRRCTNIGERWPLNSGATGLVLLAWETAGNLERFLRSWPLNALTPRTIADPVTLRATLAQVRTQGFAIRMEDPVIGVGSIAAPVIGQDGRVAAALTISGPLQRWTEEAMRNHLPELLDAANGITAALVREGDTKRPRSVGPPADSAGRSAGARAFNVEAAS